MRSKYNTAHDYEEVGQPANVPPRRRQHQYEPDDVVEIVGKPSLPSGTRASVKGINVPHDQEDFASLNRWRSAYGLPPVTR